MGRVALTHSSKYLCNQHLLGRRVGARESTGRVSQRMPIGTSTISFCSQGKPSRIPAGFWKEICALIGYIGSSWRLLAANLPSSTLAPLRNKLLIAQIAMTPIAIMRSGANMKVLNRWSLSLQRMVMTTPRILEASWVGVTKMMILSQLHQISVSRMKKCSSSCSLQIHPTTNTRPLLALCLG